MTANSRQAVLRQAVLDLIDLEQMCTSGESDRSSRTKVTGHLGAR